jgi:hypothetical protein
MVVGVCRDLDLVEGPELAGHRGAGHDTPVVV